jgi:hypothetical protein
MPSKEIKGELEVQIASWVLEAHGSNEMGFQPIRDRYQTAEGRVERAVYEVIVPFNRARELIQGVGGTIEAVIATFQPDNIVTIVGSRKALRFIQARMAEHRVEIAEYRQREQALSK